MVTPPKNTKYFQVHFLELQIVKNRGLNDNDNNNDNKKYFIFRNRRNLVCTFPLPHVTNSYIKEDTYIQHTVVNF